MNLIKAIFNLAMFLVLFLVPVSKSFAQALLCSKVFQNETLQALANAQLKELNNKSLELLNAFKSPTTDTNLKQALSKEIELITKNYFKEQNIQFSTRNFNYQGLEYSVFFIREVGTPLDDNARLLKGLLMSQKLKSIDIIFDPLLHIRDPQAAGSFNGSTSTILIGYTSLTHRMLGVSDTLRHEAQHAFEYYKIQNNEFTLARFVIENPKAEDQRYLRYLSLDEIETHIRDIRFLRNQGPLRVTKQSTTAQEKLEVLRTERLKQKINLSAELISRAQNALNILENNKAPSTREYIDNGINHSVYKNSDETITFLHKNEKEKLSENIQWALNRIKNLKLELDKYQKEIL